MNNAKNEIKQKVVVDGSKMRVIDDANNIIINDTFKKSDYDNGVISILSKVQIKLGCPYHYFMSNLEKSRIPIALTKTTERENYCTYDIVRLSTGSIQTKVIGTLEVFKGHIVGISYNKDILQDKDFCQLVKLSALHKVQLCKRGDRRTLFLATNFISELRRINRDRLIVREKARSLLVRTTMDDGKHIYYTFRLNDKDMFTLVKVGFNINELT